MTKQRPGMPTSATIALRTGFSRSTVSRALKGHPGISKRTREIIVRVARELGYAPNAAARSLVTRRSGVIGLVMGEMTNPFYPEQLERLLGYLGARGMQLMMFHVPPGHDVAEILPTVFQYRLDGCLMAALDLSEKAGVLCARHNLPIVMLNRNPGEHAISAVLCNSRAGGEQVARFLIGGGCRRLAYIAGKEETSTSQEREEGFLAGLRAARLRLHLRAVGNYRFEGGRDAAFSFLDHPEPPDAIFAANDIMALGALDGLRERGVAVPDEIAVVGFDDIRAASWPAYGLTTVAQPADAIIARAVDLLMQRIADPTLPPETVYINGRLTVRSSAR